MVKISYSKTNWLEDGSTPINATRLNNLETQYDEAIAQAAVVRADSTKEIRAEVVATLTGETPTAGRLMFSGGALYGGNGTSFDILQNIRKFIDMLNGNMGVILITGGTGGTFTTSFVAYKRVSVGAGGEKDAYFVIDDAIDLTPYSKLWAVWSVGIGAGSEATNSLSAINISTTKNGSYSVYTARIVRTATTANPVKDSVDVSALNGSYYVRIHARTNSSDGADAASATFYGIWLEV